MISNTPRTDALIYSSVDLTQSTIAGFAQTLERENAALRGWSKAQLDELHRISEALGTNDGHSSVTHIEILKEENAALREQLAIAHEALGAAKVENTKLTWELTALQKDAERLNWLERQDTK